MRLPILSPPACEDIGLRAGSGTEALQIQSLDTTSSGSDVPSTPLLPPQDIASPSGSTRRQEVAAKQPFGTKTHRDQTDLCENGHRLTDQQSEVLTCNYEFFAAVGERSCRHVNSLLTEKQTAHSVTAVLSVWFHYEYIEPSEASAEY